MENDDLLTSAEAARVLGITRQRMTVLAHSGRLGRQIANRYYVFTRAELEEYRQQPKNKGGRPKDELNAPMEYQTPQSLAA